VTSAELLGLPWMERLGDWDAKLVATRPKHLVLCTNERTLLCAVQVKGVPDIAVEEAIWLAAEVLRS